MLLSRLKKVLPVITATALSVATWALFAVGMVIVFKNSYDLMSVMIASLLAIVFACSTSWEIIRAYREWKKRNEG